MKAKLFIGLAVATVAIAATTVFTVNHFSPKSHLSSLALANLEALTGTEIDFPDSDYVHCRCHGEDCQGGNAISLRQGCGKQETTPDCNAWGEKNCK
jgi:hypothetical protein